MPYRQSAQIYDAIYEHHKDYAGEVLVLERLIDRHKRVAGNALLDVGCGTGLHDQHLVQRYEVEGLDISNEMLSVARAKLPSVRFHHADMKDFDLGREFDIVVSLFSAIGHLLIVDEVHIAVACMARHLTPGGLLLIEPWHLKGRWEPPQLETNFLPEKSVLRITESRLDNDVAVLAMHYFVGWPKNTRYFLTEHRLGMHLASDFEGAFRDAGLEVCFDESGLTGRGMFIGRKPNAG